MSKVYAHQESADLRELDASGGWYRTENDLQIFFRPIIGYKACWLYDVLCRLIPLAQKRLAEGMRLDLTHAFCAKQSGLSKSQVGREIETLVATGMVRKFERSNKRCPTYQLVSLQKLAALGVEALTGRLGDPVRVSDVESDDAARDEEQGNATPQSRVDSDESREDGESTPPSAVEAPTLKDKSGDPYRATVDEGGDLPDFDAPCTAFGAPVTQNSGVGDPGEGLSIKDKDLKQKSTPVVPVPGTAPMLLEREYVDCRPGDPEFEANLGLAARDVLRAWRVSNSRLLHQMRNALRLYATELAEQQDGPTLRVAAELAIERFAEYQEAQTSGLLRFYELPKDFMGNGTWLRPGSWPMDRRALEELRLRRAANVGVRESAEETPLERVWNAVVAGVRRRTKRADGQTSREWAAFATSLLPARLVGVKLDRETRCETWTLQVSDAAGIATWVEQLRDLVQAAAEEAGGNKVVLRVVSG